MKNERSAFYPRLALSNMKKNASIYLPYLLAGILLSGLYYMILAVGEMAAVSKMSGGSEITAILTMCAGLCIVIMFLILFYINSFVMKRRKRELGLYCILGMEKRHLCLLLFWEVLAAAVISIVFGVAFGALFSQLMFLVLLKLIRIPAMLIFTVPAASVGRTAVVFGIGYLVTYLYDCVVIFRTNPIDLLKSRQEGEREPKTKWLTALVGVVTLAGGYGIAANAETPSEGLAAFFPAALLVIIGTYCLFQAGSIVLLKFLRSRKSFYYRPENFISVSGMLYRMKQNAAGLATIAILSTALLVVLSSSVTLYAGEEGMLGGMFPREYKLQVKPDSQNSDGISAKKRASDDYEKPILEALQELARETGVEFVHDYSFSSVWWMADKQGNHFDDNVMAGQDRAFDIKKIVSLTLLSLEDYNDMTDNQETLAADEVIYIAPGDPAEESVFVNGRQFRVKRQLGALKELPRNAMNQDMFVNYVVVLPDMLTLQQVRGNDSSAETLEWQYLFELEGRKEAVEAFEALARERFLGGGLGGRASMEKKAQAREGFYLLYGSIFFIGLLFVSLFLAATVLIIYYKQVTEGYDDRERFEIMEKVGMRDSEIRRAIGKQVLIVFFLPLLTAVVHICMAARVLRMFLALLGLTDSRTFWIGMAACCLVFALVYFVIYRMTSRVYYRIVHTKASA